MASTHMAAHGACPQQNSNSVWHTLTHGLTGLVRTWREERAIAEAEQALAAMDDRLLRDIGIARDDIHYMVRTRRR